MSFIQNLFTSRDNNANAATFVGQQDRIWWNPDTNAFYYSDGNTAGGIPVGTAGTGNGVPGGPTNSIQYNAGSGTFGGTANLSISGAGLSAAGNITAAWFIGNVSATGNISLGNLYINDQTLGGKNLNANIILLPEGDGWVTVPKLALDGLTVANTGTAIQFDTTANIDIELNPGVGGNILTAGTIKPTGNNIAGLGAIDSRYSDLWLGSGNINLIDDTLNINQQINAINGNIVMSNSTGLLFGNFQFYGNTMALANAAANIEIGTANATGWVQFNRAIAVTETAGEVSFSVDKDGRTQIRAFDGTPANTPGALNIVASSDGNYQNVTNSGGMLHLTGPANSASRITVDAYGSQGGSGSPGVLVFRSARGNATTPTATQANDTLARISAVGWGNTPGFGAGATLAATAIEFVALETFTPTAQGTKITFNTANIGANSRSVSATIQANGVSFANNTTANSGITFYDGSFQNTAYSPTTSVGSATAATGISIAPTSTSATGNITITNTGVITVAGTSNQVFVGAGNATVAANGAVQLSLPQDIAPSSSPTFNTLTVTNLNILGNVSNVIPSVVDGPIIYVANTATAFPNINNSGLITGNAANGVYAGILYTTGGLYANTWDMTIGNSIGIFAGNLYADLANVQTQIHAGNAVAQLNYPYAVIQADMDEDSYTQVVFQNHNQGANASADFVAVANNGDDGNFYIDMGMNSNIYNNSDYALMGPNDGYLYVNGGNLNIGTQTSAKIIEFFTGGTNSTTFIRGVVSDSGLSMVGNVTANNFIGNSLATTNGISATGTITGGNIVSLNTVSATGNIQGQNLLTTGIISATGNIQGGNLRTTGLISATGNITAGNLITATTVIDGGISTSGNVTGANIFTSGTVSATGNIDGSNIIANLAIISSTLSILGNIQGGNLLTSGVISTTGNAVFGNISTAGRAIFTGNVDAGNVRTTGIVTATGNVSTAGFFVGDGGFISNITVATPTKIVNGTSWANIAASGGNLTIAIAGNTIANVAATGAHVTGIVSASGNVTGGNLVGQNLTAGRVAIVGSGKEVSDDAEFTYNSSTNILSVVGNVVANNFIGNIISANNISNVGNVFVQGNIQYNLATEDGGNVTQLTNKATAVTCNGRTGRITTSASPLAGGGSVTFVVNNTYVQQYDLIILNVKDPVLVNTYHAQVNGVGTNSFNIMIRNVDNNAHSDAIILSFALIQVR
jgi:hypothetical protein